MAVVDYESVHAPPILFVDRATVAPRSANTYVSTVGSNSMPRADSIPFSWFQWIVTGGVVAIVSLIGLLYWGLRSDIGELKTSDAQMTSAVTQDRVETVRAIGEVKAEIATTNGKLDILIDAVKTPKKQ